MYADKYGQRTKFEPGSAGLSLALIGLIGTGLAFSSPTFQRAIEPTLVGWNIPLQPPKPDPKPLPKPVTQQTLPQPTAKPVAPDPIVHFDQQPDTKIDTGSTMNTGITEGTVGVTPIKPTPVIIGPQVDTRFAGILQPEYPAGERRAEHQGRVVVRVLIGVDGRVKQVEKISAASDAFFAATQKRALEKWRFKPGTQDGVPIEAWRTMTVSFVLSQDSGLE